MARVSSSQIMLQRQRNHKHAMRCCIPRQSQCSGNSSSAISLISFTLHAPVCHVLHAKDRSGTHAPTSPQQGSIADSSTALVIPAQRETAARSSAACTQASGMLPLRATVLRQHVVYKLVHECLRQGRCHASVSGVRARAQATHMCGSYTSSRNTDDANWLDNPRR
jgi:hypothetical protein